MMFKMKIILSLLLLLISYEVTSAATVDRIIATVNKEVITLTDFKKYVTKHGGITSGDSIDEALLKNMIEERIILQEAVKKGVTATDEEADQGIRDFLQYNSMTKEEFEKRIAEQRVTLNEYREMLKDNLVIVKFIEKEIDSKIIITKQELLDYYDRNKSDFAVSPARVQLKLIFIRVAASAFLTEITDVNVKLLRIYAEIEQGVPFDELVRQYSEKSDLGNVPVEFKKGELLPPLEKEVATMKVGDISQPVWVEEGVYVINLRARTDETYSEFGSVEEQIFKTLFKKKRDELYDSWIKSLWSRSSVTIN